MEHTIITIFIAIMLFTLGTIMGFKMGRDAVQIDAVKNGVANYAADNNGAVLFVWDVPAK